MIHHFCTGTLATPCTSILLSILLSQDHVDAKHHHYTSWIQSSNQNDNLNNEQKIGKKNRNLFPKKCQSWKNRGKKVLTLRSKSFNVWGSCGSKASSLWIANPTQQSEWEFKPGTKEIKNLKSKIENSKTFLCLGRKMFWRDPSLQMVATVHRGVRT